MRKNIILLVAIVFMAGCLTACGVGERAAAGDGRLSIVTTIFPEYDWVMNILGDNAAQADVTMLLDNGVDLHSFQPTAADILKISTCDLFIYVGGESDTWVDDALKAAVNKDMVVINLLELLGDAVKEEEIVEGMQESEHEHEHGHEHGEDGHEHEEDEHEEDGHEHGEDGHEHGEDGHEHEEDGHEHGEDGHEHEEDGHEHEHGDEVEYDEHVWLSLRNAAVLAEGISAALCKVDPQHAADYKANTAAYVAKLNALDAEFKAAVSAGTVKTLLFGDRFPFRYFVDDYDLSYYAAFVGCSAESEASFETVTFLAQKVDELGLPAVMTIEGADHRIAQTIVQNTKSKDQKILTMDSMQGTTAKDVKNGVTYLSVMEKNLEVLKEALR